MVSCEAFFGKDIFDADCSSCAGGKEMMIDFQLSTERSRFFQYGFLFPLLVVCRFRSR